MLGKSTNTYPEKFQPGTRVKHYLEDGEGTVTELDYNLIDSGFTSTTCRVLWDDSDGSEDIQWTNKLIIVN